MAVEVQSTSTKLSYVSTLPRRAFAYKSDRLAIWALISSMRRHQMDRAENGNVDEEGIGKIPEGTFPIYYQAVDAIRSYMHCGALLIGKGPEKNFTHIPRIFKLHTSCTALDRCHQCQERTLFD